MILANGTPATKLAEVLWVKSERSNSQGACVEFARIDNGLVAMRNSRDPEGAALIYPLPAVQALMTALRSGEFEFLLS
jgi:hypothetical protein